MSSKTLAGTVIDEKFRLDEQIGEGSMGAVYRGTQLMVDRPVAVKLLHPGFSGHDKIQARFEVEARAIARLNHPHCITLYDFGYSEEMEAFYTVVEYIDGLSLEALVDRQPAIDRVVNLVKQAASALGHAHHHGILHRDLKPENIMLAEMTDGTEMAKVLDFGIAQIMQGHGDDEAEDDDFEADRLTRVGEVFGTPPYMSPEQSKSTHDLTPATDLYSLGVIFYELLEGRLPFMADTPAQIMMMHREQQPPPLQRPGIPEAVESIVFQMLDKDPEARPESGDEIAKMLGELPDEQLQGDFDAADTEPSSKADVEPTLLTSPVEPDDQPRQSESTLMSAPPDSDAVAEATEIDSEPTTEASPRDTGPRPTADDSRPEPDAAPNNTATSERPAISPDERPDSDPGVKSTRMLGDDEDLDIDSALETVAGHRRKMIAGLLATLLVAGASLVWLFVEHDPFSMADEEEMSEVGEIAAVDTESTSSDDPDDESVVVDEDAAGNDGETQPPAGADPGADSPREVAVSDESDEDHEDDEDDNDEEEPDEETADSEDEADADPSPAQPRPTPSPRETTGDETDDADTPPRLDGPDESDDNDRPPRLDL